MTACWGFVMIDTRTLDLYALHPESVPPEYSTRPMRDRHGRRLRVGSVVRVGDMGRLRIVGRHGGWVDLVDETGEPHVLFIAALEEVEHVGKI